MNTTPAYGTYLVTGLMSGSSLDGVDLAACSFTREGKGWTYRILAAETIPYSALLRERLLHATMLPPDEVHRLDKELGAFFGDLVNRFHDTAGFRPGLVSSHGHTLFHEPEKGITFQAGNGLLMAERTEITVVNDFRREDVKQGGQGAPLVPAGDKLLFGEYDSCLNLGGIANISYDNEAGRRIAFDICPVNMAFNYLAELVGKEYDHEGKIARSGTVDPVLLRRLDELPFYGQDHPRSLGREWFMEQFLPVLTEGDLPVGNRMATAVEHTAGQVSAAIHQSGAESVLVTGGGALNNFFLDRLKSLVGSRIVVPDEKLVVFKEALVFAFLGLLRWLGEINCFASVTGGRDDLSAGIIHHP